MNKTVTAILVAAVILLGGFFLLRGKSYQQPASPTQQTVQEEKSESVPETQVEKESAKEETQETQEEIVIDSGSFFFKPSQLKAQSGKVTVKVNNNNGFHTFVIDALNVKERLSSGKTFTFSAEPGTYEYYCDVPGHKEQGMFGTLKVE